MPDARTGVVIAERWSVLRRGLAGLLAPHMPVLAEVDTPADLVPTLRRRAVELVMIGDGPDVHLRTTVASLLRIDPDLCIGVLCDDIGADTLRALLREGVQAVISKSVGDEHLLDGIGRLRKGERVIDQRFLPLLFGGDLDAGHAVGDPDSILTPRELEVLGELARGSSNKQIAETLFVGVSTVKTHLVRIYTKLEVDDRHRAVGRALELGLLK